MLGSKHLLVQHFVQLECDVDFEQEMNLVETLVDSDCSNEQIFEPSAVFELEACTLEMMFDDLVKNFS